jgi:dihydropteroate synthase
MPESNFLSRFPGGTKPYTLRFGGSLLDLSQPRVMGILNLSLDSFFSGSRMESLRQLVLTAQNMAQDGVDILDLGAVSSRPGSKLIPEEEEEALLMPALRLLKAELPDVPISIDTFRANTARRALDEGACMINDIFGGAADPDLFPLLAKARVPYVIMHNRGDFATQHQPQSYSHLTSEVLLEMQKRIWEARLAGIADVIADPGFGFSKNGNQNFELLRDLQIFRDLDCPLLVGISRKSMIYKTLGVQPGDALNGTTALHMAALLQGAHILRVHDVAEARQTIQLFMKLCSPES